MLDDCELDAAPLLSRLSSISDFTTLPSLVAQSLQECAREARFRREQPWRHMPIYTCEVTGADKTYSFVLLQGQD